MPRTACECGCGFEALATGFARGHASRFRSSLRRRVAEHPGDVTAFRGLYEHGWTIEPPPGKRSFGFEAEFLGIRRDHSVELLRDNGIHAQDDGYHHSPRPYWRVTEDGSVNGEANELVSPILATRQADFQIAHKVVKVLRDNGASTDRSCGLHVHHDATGMNVPDIAEAVMAWTVFQPIINTILTASRHDVNYAMPMYNPRHWHREIMRFPSLNRLKESAEQHWGRYHAINLGSLAVHGTLEFRQHQGTLNGTKIEHWARFTKRFMRVERGSVQALINLHGSMEAVERMGLRNMCAWLKVPSKTTEFLVGRQAALRSPMSDAEDSAQDEDAAPSGRDDGNPDPDGDGTWCGSCYEYHYDNEAEYDAPENYEDPD